MSHTMIPYQTYTQQDLEVFKKQTVQQINDKKNNVFIQQKIQKMESATNFGIRLLKHIDSEFRQNHIMNGKRGQRQNNSIQGFKKINQFQRQHNEKKLNSSSSKKYINVYSSINKDKNLKDQKSNLLKAEVKSYLNGYDKEFQYSQKPIFQQTVKIRELINLKQLQQSKGTIKQEVKQNNQNQSRSRRQFSQKVQKDGQILLYAQPQSYPLNEWKQHEQKTKLRKNWQNYSFSKQPQTYKTLSKNRSNQSCSRTLNTIENNKLSSDQQMRHGISEFVLQKQQQSHPQYFNNNNKNAKQQKIQDQHGFYEQKQGNYYNRIQKNLTNLENGVKQLSFRIRGLQVSDINIVGYYSDNNLNNKENNKVEQQSHCQDQNLILKNSHKNNNDDSINSLDIVEQSDIKRSQFYSQEQDQEQSRSQLQKNEFLIDNSNLGLQKNSKKQFFKQNNQLNMQCSNDNLFQNIIAKQNQNRQVEIHSQMIGSLEVCEIKPIIVKNKPVREFQRFQNLNQQNNTTQKQLKKTNEQKQIQIKNNKQEKKIKVLNLQNVLNFVHIAKAQIEQDKVQKDISKNQIENLLPQRVMIHANKEKQEKNFMTKSNNNPQNPEKKLNYQLLKVHKNKNYSIIKKKINVPIEKDQDDLIHNKRKFIKYKVFYQKRQENY